ncbi:MAG: SPOR domain-containing protein [Leptospiraceae bacterium]|nr:SPOR domain-containing protein [Leptospiraceae bacterium]
MKKRVFYVVNLDKNRLLALSIFVGGTLVMAFATGYRFGRTDENLGPQQAQQSAFDNASQTPTTSSVDSDSLESDREESDPLERRQSDSELSLKSASPDEEARPAVKTESKTEPSKKKKPESVSFSDIARKQDDSTPRKKEPTPAYKKPEKSKPKPANQVTEKKKTTKPSPAALVKKETAPTQAKEKPRSGPIYTLQLGAFTSRGAANRMAEQIRKEGMQPYVVKSGNLHLVRLGRSEKESGLKEEEKKLRAAKFRPIKVTVGD